MSFLHPSATPVVRSRRTKDGGSRNVVIGIARRRETSKPHEDKSTTSTQSTAGDAPSVGEPDPESPSSSPTSPEDIAKVDEKSQRRQEGSIIPFSEAASNSRLVTPIALRQYLEHESAGETSKTGESDGYQPPYVTHDDFERLDQTYEPMGNRKDTIPDTTREGSLVPMADGADIAQSSGAVNLSSQYHAESDPAPMERGIPLHNVPLLVPSPWESPFPPFYPQPHEQFQDHAVYFGVEDRVETPRLARGDDPAAFEPATTFPYHISGQPGVPFNQMLAYGPPPPAKSSPFGYHHENEDIFSTLHQVNNVLPKLEAFLEQNFASPTEVNYRGAENLMVKRGSYDVSQEKEQMRRSSKSAEKLRTQLEEEKGTLQTKLNEMERACRHLEACLQESKAREEKLCNDVEELRRVESETAARSRQSEAALESFIQWLLRQSENKESTESSEAQTVYITERASEDHIEVAVHSIVASVPQAHNNLRGDCSPEHENLPIPGSFCEILPTNEHLQSSSARSETQLADESALNYSPWLSRGWETAATNTRVKLLEEDLARLRYETEEHGKLLLGRHEEEKQDLRALIDASETRSEKRCQRLQADNTALSQENELLKARIASQQAWSVQSTLEVRECATRVDKESRTLRKVLEANLAASHAFNTGREDR